MKNGTQKKMQRIVQNKIPWKSPIIKFSLKKIQTNMVEKEAGNTPRTCDSESKACLLSSPFDSSYAENQKGLYLGKKETFSDLLPYLIPPALSTRLPPCTLR
eukprot:TRINITY_DN68518_c0_g1_i1.p2 TRINITY_DN68518_c0_g1~~TRINITY_DN68518_c0_g1_i1.p2  ORF type:complete len:102 (-),score=10.57 TRINITY_DN68518_c0_g1_i1:197-502(-)